MNEEVKIIKLAPERWSEFKELRLEALREEPLAFGKSPSEEENKQDDFWIRILEKKNPLTLFAEKNGKLAGMVTIIFAVSEKFRHIARFSGVYVKKEFRGQGIAKNMLSQALETAFAKEGVIKVKVIVNVSQEAAVALYKSLGFKEAGRMEKEFKVGENYYDAFLLENQKSPR